MQFRTAAVAVQPASGVQDSLNAVHRTIDLIARSVAIRMLVRLCEIDFPNPLVKLVFLETTISDFQETMQETQNDADRRKQRQAVMYGVTKLGRKYHFVPLLSII